jgi:hypothetical protein
MKHSSPKANTYIRKDQYRGVGIVTGYMLDWMGGGSASLGIVKNFKFSMSSRPALGLTQPPIQWLLWGSLPTSAEAKQNVGLYM